MPQKNKPSLVDRVLISTIHWYQRHLSPDHSPRKVHYPYGYCRFTPTCSEYGCGSIEKYGAIKGSFMAIWRIIRCNPWNKGGSDPVP